MLKVNRKITQISLRVWGVGSEFLVGEVHRCLSHSNWAFSWCLLLGLKHAEAAGAFSPAACCLNALVGEIKIERNGVEISMKKRFFHAIMVCGILLMVWAKHFFPIFSLGASHARWLCNKVPHIFTGLGVAGGLTPRVVSFFYGVDIYAPGKLQPQPNQHFSILLNQVISRIFFSSALCSNWNFIEVSKTFFFSLSYITSSSSKCPMLPPAAPSAQSNTKLQFSHKAGIFLYPKKRTCGGVSFLGMGWRSRGKRKMPKTGKASGGEAIWEQRKWTLTEEIS